MRVLVPVGEGADPPATGGIGKVTRDAVAADTGLVNLTDTTPAGLYEISYVFANSAIDQADAVMRLDFTYNGIVGARTDSSASLSSNASGLDAKVIPVRLVSGNIQWRGNQLSGTFDTGRFSITIRCKYLG